MHTHCYDENERDLDLGCGCDGGFGEDMNLDDMLNNGGFMGSGNGDFGVEGISDESQGFGENGFGQGFGENGFGQGGQGFGGNGFGQGGQGFGGNGFGQGAQGAAGNGFGPVRNGRNRVFNRSFNVNGTSAAVVNRDFYNNYYNRYNNYFIRNQRINRDFVYDYNIVHVSNQSYYAGCQYLGSCWMMANGCGNNGYGCRRRCCRRRRRCWC